MKVINKVTFLHDDVQNTINLKLDDHMRYCMLEVPKNSYFLPTYFRVIPQV